MHDHSLWQKARIKKNGLPTLIDREIWVKGPPVLVPPGVGMCVTNRDSTYREWVPLDPKDAGGQAIQSCLIDPPSPGCCYFLLEDLELQGEFCALPEFIELTDFLQGTIGT